VNKHVVSREILYALSSPGGMSNRTAERIRAGVVTDNSQSMKRFIEDYILPAVVGEETRKPGFKETLKYALWYYLHKQPWDPDALFERQEPLIYLPDPPLKYYQWVWELLFAGQENQMPPIDDDHFVVVR
jgi:hypothetical protein